MHARPLGDFAPGKTGSRTRKMCGSLDACAFANFAEARRHLFHGKCWPRELEGDCMGRSDAVGVAPVHAVAPTGSSESLARAASIDAELASITARIPAAEGLGWSRPEDYRMGFAKKVPGRGSRLDYAVLTSAPRLKLAVD